MHNLIEKEGQRFISVFFPGHTGKSAPDSHPNFDKILASIETDPTDASVMDLFDVEKSVINRFETLSERVSVRDGKLFLDGNETHNALADQVVRFLYDKVDDWKPLIKFYENVLSNPNKHSQEQLFNWLAQHQFVIDDDGYLIGYKAVYASSEGVYRSSRQGYAIVDGVVIENDYTPYKIGSVVTMPRDRVQHDPTVGCSHGLHVGTFNYASSFLSNGYVLRVRVNPRDVVSVPTECSWAKLRVCRLEVLEVNPVEFQEPLAYYGKPENDEPPRLIPASEWQRSHSGTDAFAEIDIDEIVDAVPEESLIRPLSQYLNPLTPDPYSSYDYEEEPEDACYYCGSAYCDEECQNCEDCGNDPCNCPDDYDY